MKDNKTSSETKVDLVDLLQVIDKSVKERKAKNPERPPKIEDLPTVREVLDKLITPGTALYYPEKEITFNSKLSPVKSLQVRVCSTEANNQSVLHRLHSLTRA